MSRRRWLVVGAGGMLGQDLMAVLTDAGEAATGLTRSALDITDAHACHEAVREAEVVVNCAAYTAVDDAETHEADAFAVNARGAAVLATAAASAKARLIHISTDYVFGNARRQEPWAEHHPIAPESAYGRTKAAGEWAVAALSDDHLIIRTAWLYGQHGSCFPKTIARLLADRETISVVDDQRGQPTWTRDLAKLIHRLVAAEAAPGVYHGTSSGAATWHELAREVAVAVGVDTTRVHPTSTAAFPRPAKRPAYSVLGHDALERVGVDPIGDWRDRFRTAAASVLPS